VFLFSLQLLSTTFPIPRKNELDTVINVHRSSCKIPVSKIWIFSTNLKKKHSNIQFYENPSLGGQFIPCGRTNRRTQTDVMNLTVPFRSFVNLPRRKNYEVASDCIFHRYFYEIPFIASHIIKQTQAHNDAVSLSYFKRNQVKNNGHFTRLRMNKFHAHVGFQVDTRKKKRNTVRLVCNLIVLNWRENLVVLQT